MENGSAKQILVVEDETVVALDMKNRLERLGYEVIEILDSGEDAITYLENNTPDIILMDIKLKGKIDGITAAEEIRKSKSVPVVYITAYSDRKTFERAKDTEAFGYILKPFQERELLISIEMSMYKHKMEQKLRRSESMFRNLFTNSSDAMITCDMDGKINLVNKTAENIFGWEQKQIQERPISYLFPGYNRNTIMQNVKEIKDNPSSESIHSEIEAMRKDGSVFQSEIGFSLGGTKEENFIICSIRDTTERVEFEAALKQAKLSAEEANRAKTEFLTNMSHELRTPLNSIMGMTELSMDMVENPEVREYMAISLQSAHSLLMLINSILDFSKIEAGKLEVVNTEFNPREIVEEAVSAFMGQAAKKGILLLSRVDPNIPDSIIGDSGKLKQILLNLVGNAIKFTRQGRVMAEAVLASREERDGNDTADIIFRVRDTGGGIQEDKIESVFEVFTQADGSVTRVHGGSGLGLAICKRISELLGGNIAVEETGPKGTTFRVSLSFPVNTEASHMQMFDTITSDVPVYIIVGTSKEAEVLKELVHWWGFEANTFNSCQKALGKWHKKPQKAVFLIDGSISDREHIVEESRGKGDKEIDNLRTIVIADVGGEAELFWSRYDERIHIIRRPVRAHILYDLLKKVAEKGQEKTGDRSSSFVTEKDRRHRAKTVLIVEDDKNSRFLAKKILENRGHLPVTAENGAEGLKQLKKQHTDVVLMDLQMPEMDGYEATRLIRDGKAGKEYKDVPIIALTAHALPSVKERCFEAGMDGYISKPFDPEDLYTVLERLLYENTQEENTDDNGAKIKGKTKTENNAEAVDNFDENFNTFIEEVPQLLENGQYEKLLAQAKEMKNKAVNAGETGLVNHLFRLSLASRREDNEKILSLLGRIKEYMYSQNDNKE